MQHKREKFLNYIKIERKKIAITFVKIKKRIIQDHQTHLHMYKKNIHL